MPTPPQQLWLCGWNILHKVKDLDGSDSQRLVGIELMPTSL